MLSDQLYVNAKVPATDKVCLWLGANVMLEYDIEEAEQLLTNNHMIAQDNLTELDDDLNFLRDQITTTEVSILFQKKFRQPFSGRSDVFSEDLIYLNLVSPRYVLIFFYNSF